MNHYTNTLYNLINNFKIAYETNYKGKKHTVSALKNIDEFKTLSNYIKGGTSKLKSDEINDLINKLLHYEKNKFIINGKEIIPDNEQQLIIDSPIDKNLRIVSGAGAGKTTTIMMRIKYLIDNYVLPNKILVLTFNVESRRNLEQIMNKMIGFDTSIDIRTIDSFCCKIINTYEPERNINSLSMHEYGYVGAKLMKKYGAYFASQYKYIFFDEFQDVDENQFDILKEFSKHKSYLTVIGDDSQNIYQFRGSDNHYIINFDTEIENVLTYKITTNYRSTKEIIDLSNKAIDANIDKIHKKMKACEKNNVTGCQRLIFMESEEKEIDYLINKIDYYVKKKGFEYHNIAILARCNKILDILNTEFHKYDIPSVILTNDNKLTIQDNKVLLSTIHKTKGLEWSIVFIVGLSDMSFPTHMNNGMINIEEERRLFYVAVSRAKQYLYLLTNRSEAPVSRFVKEIIDHVSIINKTTLTTEQLFAFHNECYLKKTYSIEDLVGLLNGAKLNDMRDNKLLSNERRELHKLFENKTEDFVPFIPDIKKGGYENDFSNYCKTYILRQIMIKNEQSIRDVDCEVIILNNFKNMLSSEEKQICEIYDLASKYVDGKLDTRNMIIQKEDEFIIEKIKGKLALIKSLKFGINILQMMLTMNKYVYPKKFMKKFLKSYNYYCDLNNIVFDDSLDQSIYYISLVPNFMINKHRLVYHNIHSIYKEMTEKIIGCMNDYVTITNENIICKQTMTKTYTYNGQTILLVDIIDMIDIDNQTLIMIKASEENFNMEWIVHMLMQYSLFMFEKEQNKRFTDIEITKIKFVNILRSNYYNYDIPKDYDYISMMETMDELLMNNLKGIRTKNKKIIGNQLCYIIENNKQENNKQENNYKQNIIKMNIKKGKKYMVLDVENNISDQQIIQISYIIYDMNNDTELKRIDYYIKNRVVDNLTTQKTNITNDILIKKGVEFIEVIKTLIEDLSSVSTIIGHNIKTDIAKIKKNIIDNDIIIHNNNNENIHDVFAHLDVLDTMVMYKKIYPKESLKLCDVYEKLFKKKPKFTHNSIYDVIYTAQCYVNMKKNII